MTDHAELSLPVSLNLNRLAIGLVVDDESDRLEMSIRSAKSLTEHVFLLDLSAETLLSESENTLFRSRTPNDRGASRNELLEQIESNEEIDWVLWMHAGERFDPGTLADFQQFIESEANRNSLYMMVLRRFVRPDEKRHDFDEETIDARLMPLRKGLRFAGKLKESPLASASELMISLSAAPGRFLCPSKFIDLESRKVRGKKRLHLIDELDRQGEAMVDELLAFRAEAKIDLGDYVGARNDLLKLVEETRKTNLRLEAFYGIWETLMFSPLPINETTKILVAGLDFFPVDMQLLTCMGTHLQRQGRLDLAVRTYETAIKFGRISLDVWHRLHVREVAVVALALVRRMQGKGAEAIRVLEANLDRIEDKDEYSRHLLNLYIAEREETKAHNFAATLWGEAELDRMRSVLTGACRAAAGAWEQAVQPLESAYRDGCRDLFCLRWYSLTLLSLVRFQDAIPVLEEWVAADPGGTEAPAFLFGARNPEHFSETVDRMRAEQLQLLGPGAKLRERNAQLDGAIREMVAASGKDDSNAPSGPARKLDLAFRSKR